uniref:F-box domain-containing protein n=1 Tax=Caenorhabditis japonica TaxID=281687 RepID=A0A8R1DZ50_CAEJA
MESSVRLSLRKRRNSESQPTITKFFTTVKRDRSLSESKNVSQKLEESINPAQKEVENAENLLYSEDELRDLLGIPSPSFPNDIPNGENPIGLENLPKKIYSYIFTILDLHSVNSLSLTSTTMASRVKCYVAGHEFYRRIHLDQLDFMDSSIRPDDEEFDENDPFTACGALIKSITITLDTKVRAQVFLNICRNLRIQLGGSLHGFGRLLEAMTQHWKFSERRIMVKAAILIDNEVRLSLIKVLTSSPGKYVGLEMKVRSRLTELFLNRNQEIEDTLPDEIIEFGSWLSILLRNAVDKYQGKLYYVLFGPTKLSRTGECVDWMYFGDDNNSRATLRKSEANYKKIMTTLLNGIRALRVMSNSKNSDQAWDEKKIYQLFLRIVGSCEREGAWSETACSMALAIDTSGLFSEYLISHLDPRRNDYSKLLDECAEMVCLVRTHLYRWSSTPATFLAEPLHHVFNHLAQIDGHYGGNYKLFLDKIWKTQKARMTRLVECARNTTEWNLSIRDELDGQLSMVRLLSDFTDVVPLRPAVRAQAIREPHEQDEQQEE